MSAWCVLAATLPGLPVHAAGQDWANEAFHSSAKPGTPAEAPAIEMAMAGQPKYVDVPPPSPDLTVPPSATNAPASGASAPAAAIVTPPSAAQPSAAQPSVAPPSESVAAPKPTPAITVTTEVKPEAGTNAPVEEHAKGKTLYSFKATDLDLKTALAMFARANDLNIVPDNDIAGTVTLDVRDLALNQMMRALLEAGDCSWVEEGGLIRVHNTETRMFNVNYLRLIRTGQGQSSATLNSASAGGAGGGGGGGGGAGGGGAGGGSSSSSTVNLSANNPISFWTELQVELSTLLADKGKAVVNMTAGIIEVTGRPSAMKKVEHYLSNVDQSIHRQVEIEAKLYDVTLNDQFQFGIDWQQAIQSYGGRFAALAGGPGMLPVGSSFGSFGVQSGSTLQATYLPNHPTFKSTDLMIDALKLQGQVEVISKPRVRALNNQTALVKVGTEMPFFASTSQLSQSSSGNVTTTSDQITTITVGTILAITPQISGDDWITLDISPVLTSLVEVRSSPSGTANAPVLDTKQASTLVRVKNGSTIALGGLIHSENSNTRRQVPVLGELPMIGKLFTSRYSGHQKKELVIFVTPTLVDQ